MTKFHIEEDYSILHTNHFIIEADTLSEAIDVVVARNFAPHWMTECEDYKDFDYSDSREVSSDYVVDPMKIRYPQIIYKE